MWTKVKTQTGRWLLPVLAALVIPLTFTGCTTPGAQTSVTITPARMGLIAELAAFDGATLYLAQHPEQRPAFDAALGALTLLKSGTNATPADVKVALDQLPIKELKGPQGDVTVGTAVILYDAFVREHVNLDSNEWLRPAIEGLHRGLARALPPLPPAR